MTADEIRAQREKCADCGGALQEVKVFDRGDNNLPLPLYYHSNEQQYKFWGGKYYPVQGTILTFMCTRCARIYFYGAAKEDTSDGKTKPADEDK